MLFAHLIDYISLRRGLSAPQETGQRRQRQLRQIVSAAPPYSARGTVLQKGGSEFVTTSATQDVKPVGSAQGKKPCIFGTPERENNKAPMDPRSRHLDCFGRAQKTQPLWQVVPGCSTSAEKAPSGVTPLTILVNSRASENYFDGTPGLRGRLSAYETLE